MMTSLFGVSYLICDVRLRTSAITDNQELALPKTPILNEDYIDPKYFKYQTVRLTIYYVLEFKAPKICRTSLANQEPKTKYSYYNLFWVRGRGFISHA